MLTPDDAKAFWTLRLSGFRDDPTSFGYSFDESAARARSSGGLALLMLPSSSS
ncbi:MAG TPA: hypothetical protein VGL81_17690 [Polyangiaceae bacterium]|jgi:hypothetical protein